MQFLHAYFFSHYVLMDDIDLHLHCSWMHPYLTVSPVDLDDRIVCVFPVYYCSSVHSHLFCLFSDP